MEPISYGLYRIAYMVADVGSYVKILKPKKLNFTAIGETFAAMNLTDGTDPEDIEEVFYELNLPVFRIVMETAPFAAVRSVFNY